MPITIKVNGTSNSLVHKGSNGVSTATVPDVCKTPSPGGPVPIPYPNISQSDSLDKGTKTVTADGGNMIAIKGSEFSRSNGDEAGTAGGVKSSTFMKESTWILYSFDVKIEGQNACRLSDKKFHNHENTVNLGGEIQQNLSPEEFDAACDRCKEWAAAQIEIDQASINEYEKQRGKHQSGGDVRDAVNRGLAQQGETHVGGATAPGRRGEVHEPPPGTPDECKPVWREATRIHEDVHELQDEDYKADHGDDWLIERDKPDNWINNEKEAHKASQDALAQFIADCESAGK